MTLYSIIIFSSYGLGMVQKDKDLTTWQLLNEMSWNITHFCVFQNGEEILWGNFVCTSNYLKYFDHIDNPIEILIRYESYE